MKKNIQDIALAVVKRYKAHRLKTTFTVAISGIDAAGKGHISRLLQAALEAMGYQVALVNTDPWQNPISIRLKREDPAMNIYENIFRWDDFFEQLILPIQKNKSISLETTGIYPHADIYYPLVYDHRNIDILLIEGILLLKKKYLHYYNYKIWIDCSFETALQRAIERNAEKLEEEQLISDYDTYYYAAQRLHFEKDGPRRSADLIFNNDPRPYCPVNDRNKNPGQVFLPKNPT